MIVALFKSTFREDLRGTEEEAAYKQTARAMSEIASATDGFISMEAFTGRDGAVLSVVRFETADALSAWRNNPEHRAAQKRGQEAWYSRYEVEVCELSRSYGFDRETGRAETSEPTAPRLGGRGPWRAAGFAVNRMAMPGSTTL